MCCSPLGHRGSDTAEQLNNHSKDTEILSGNGTDSVFSHPGFEVPAGQPGGDAQ